MFYPYMPGLGPNRMDLGHGGHGTSEAPMRVCVCVCVSPTKCQILPENPRNHAQESMGTDLFAYIP